MLSITGRPVLAAILLGAMSGCASLPHEQGMQEINALVAARIGTAPDWNANDEAQRQSVLQELLAQTSSPEQSVQIALLNNPHIQLEYARLGIARADVLQASRIANPSLTFSAMDPRGSGGRTRIDAGISLGFADLLLLPARKRIAAADLLRTQQSIGAAIVALSADVRAAWINAVAAQQIAAMRDAVRDAAQASADLATQFKTAGNLSALQQQLRAAAASQAKLDALRADGSARRARAALDQLLGLSGEQTQQTISERLPMPVETEDTLADLLAESQRLRLDLAAARNDIAALEQNLALSRRFRGFGRVDFGAAAERDSDGSRLYGPSIALQLPLFDQGQAAIARADAQLSAGRARLHALELAIDSEIRLGVDRVGTARDIVEIYRSALVPQRENIVARTQENVNFMLVGAFELLLAKQQEYEAYQGYIEAVQDYWLARVDLSRAIGARLPSDANLSGATIDAHTLFEPPDEASMQHDGHVMAMPHASGPAHPHPAESHESTTQQSTESNAIEVDEHAPAPVDASPAPAASHEHHGDSP